MRPRYLREADSLPAGGVYENGVITLPLRGGPNAELKRAKRAKRANVVQVPIADDQDFSYGVAIDIGGQSVTFQVDTGSADLWSMTTDCQTPSGDKCSNSSSIPAYTPSSTFISTNAPLQINYGSSAQPTFASGTIGLDNMTFGGLTQSEQAFASMDRTNNQITQSYSGIFGVGFPYISKIVTTIVDDVLSRTTAPLTGKSLLSTYFQAMEESSPLLISLAAAGKLRYPPPRLSDAQALTTPPSAPMYTLSLQREDPTSAGSNAGVMTIGGLPSGISNASLTWVPVQPYAISTALFGGLQTPIDPAVLKEAEALMPTTPMLWEAAIDGLGLTALFDSGTTQTLITANDVQSVTSMIPAISSDGTLPCNTVLNLAIGIGGKQFAINPFDLIEPLDSNDSAECAVGISQADPPTATQTFSYILGDAIFRSTLIAFYWGNLTDQASDPARMGFLSTTDAGAADAEYSSFWASAGTGFAFPTAAPEAQVTTTSIANPISAGSSGASGGGSSSGGSGSKSNGASALRLGQAGWAAAAVVCFGWVASML
ncbi:acid protease [Athelia psychrophila]|uniref:Acid protease n=1 Tax=Athelia psychrophila TaxID=1759441 RepID=A0A166EZZ4_9AGAM|nr:acid protease [Fibularhizoctonia sp. CBS 109695]